MQTRLPNPTPAATDRNKRASLFALGCRLNQAEAALLADQLREAGFEIVPWGEPAGLLVVNSCTVTAAAAAKTRAAVRAARKRLPGAFIILTGCDATVAADAWAEDAAAVDCIVPNAEKHIFFAAAAKKITLGGQRVRAAAENISGPGTQDSGPGTHGGATVPLPHRHTTTPPDCFTLPGTGHFTGRTRANLKIQEGCNVGCSYCIIPQARGAPTSRDWDDTLREVRELAARGHREIVLAGINLALYDAGGGRRLPELIRAILGSADGFRLRLSSLEPGLELPRILDLMAQETGLPHSADPFDIRNSPFDIQPGPRLCRHLHLPLQYADDRMLTAMRRPYTVGAYAEFASDAVRRVPGLCLGTDIIVGFPGETDAIFAAARDALAALPLAYLHVFTFSPRPGTAAAALPGRVPGDIAKRRQQELEALSRDKAETFVRSRLGQTVELLTERRRRQDDPPHGTSGEFIEVTLANAPPELPTNTLVTATLTAATGNRSARAEFASTH